MLVQRIIWDLTHSIVYITSLKYRLPNSPFSPFPPVPSASCSTPHAPEVQMEFPVFHQPKSLSLLVASPPIHPGQAWVRLHARPSPCPQLPCSSLRLAWGCFVFTLAEHSAHPPHCRWRDLSQQSQPGPSPARLQGEPHSSKQEQPSGCGHALEARLSWANSPLPTTQCQG